MKDLPLPNTAFADSPSISVSIPGMSVMIVSWNVAELLADCPDSLARETDGLKLEVWIVDIASSDNTVAMLQSRYPWTDHVECKGGLVL